MQPPFIFLSRLRLPFVVAMTLLVLCSCVEEFERGSNASLTASSNAGGTRTSSPKLNKHDVALRFLTAYIRLDKRMALQFASPQAVEKLDWTRRHSGNIPYYDDKMLLYFSGGWARVYFQEVDGSYLVSDLEVHRKR